MSESEDRARRMGWVPQEDFRGDPDKWRTAEQFLEVGDNLMPVLKERLQTLEEKFDSETGTLKEKLDKANSNLQKLSEHHRKMQDNSMERARKQVQQEMREAAAAGNMQAYDELAQHSEQLKEPVVPPVTPEFTEWVKDNQWYQEDPALASYADQLGPHIATMVDNDVDFYKEISKRTKMAFPDHAAFKPEGEPVVNQPVVPVAPVEGAGLGGGQEPAGSKKWADLPADAKEAYETEFSDMGEHFTKEDYAKDYFAQFEEGE